MSLTTGIMIFVFVLLILGMVVPVHHEEIDFTKKKDDNGGV